MPLKIDTAGNSRSTMSSIPLQDISNVTSGSKHTKATKSARKVGVVAKTRTAANVSKAPFPISCDMGSTNPVLHLSISTDAQYGHSPPEERGMIMEFNSPGPAEHELIIDNVEPSAADGANSDDDLSSSDEEDMVIS